MDISRFRGTARAENAFSELSGLSSVPSDEEFVENPKQAKTHTITSSGVQTDAYEATRVVELSGHSVGVGDSGDFEAAENSEPGETPKVPEQRAGEFQRSVVRRATLGVSRVSDSARVRRSGAPKIVKNSVAPAPASRESVRDEEPLGDSYNVTRAGRMRPRGPARLEPREDEDYFVPV